MTQNWIEYEGRVVGAWRLDSFLGIRDGMAVFESSNEDGGSIVKLLMLDDERANSIRGSWARANQFSDSHLLKVYAVGEAEWDGTIVTFAVMEKADIGVEEILAERPVSADEARSLVAGVANALDYLHQRKLQHGSVIPSQMYVVGDAVKLGVDTISAGDDGGWESDMRQLGSTLTDAMFAGASGLSWPFHTIAAGCLGTEEPTWTAQRVLQALAGNTIVEELPPQPTHRRWPLIATAAVVVFGVLGYWGVSEPVHRAAPVTVPPQVVASELVASDLVAAPVAESTRARTVTPPVAKKAVSQSGWAVIAAAYVSREAAEGRAAQIAKHSPAVRTQVFTSSSGTRMSYVLLGAGLTRAEADRVLRVARQAGAPRDAYVTKLIEK